VNSSTVSVVISAYSLDRCPDLKAAIESVRGQPNLGEIIVSVDHNPELLQRVRQELPDVVTVANCEARGLSGARNSGVAIATSDIVAFLDDDAVATRNWINELLRWYNSPDVVGVGGSIEPSWSDQRPVWFPEEFDWVVGCTYRGMPERPEPVRNLIGANMSFRREVLNSAGGFRSGIGRVGTLPVGCEETELCIRVSQMNPGAQFIFNPDARVIHTVPSHRGTWTYYRRRCFAEGRSKHLVSTFVGANDGLANERTYTFKTLPIGVVRNLGRALTRRELSSLRRGAAIVAGLAITTAGFVSARWFLLKDRQRGANSPPSDGGSDAALVSPEHSQIA